jgi:hypothetical protein
MLLSKETQTLPFGPTKALADKSDPPKALIYQEKVAIFDPSRPAHRHKLREWCSLQWAPTFLRSFDSYNTIFYHDCCSCFSRRGFKRHSGHPPLQTRSILQISSFKEVASAEDFYQWLLGVLQRNHDYGQTTYFPGINRYHLTDQNMDQEEDDEDGVCLQKRLLEMKGSMERYGDKLRDLSLVNQQLLNSTKSWYQKYQDLLDEHHLLPNDDPDPPFKLDHL